MLRALVLLLLLANGLLWAWRSGALAPLLPVPGQAQREPARLERQVRPDAVRLLEPGAARAAVGAAVRAAQAAEAEALAASGAASGVAAAASAAEPAVVAPAVPATCWEAGPFDLNEQAAVEKALREAAGLAGLRWAVRRGERGGEFVVTMGRYTDRALYLRKQDELRRLGVAFTELTGSPTLSPGLQIGPVHTSRQAATDALADAVRQGVKTARVAMLVAPTPVAVLRVEPAASAVAARLGEATLGPAQARFVPCQGVPGR